MEKHFFCDERRCVEIEFPDHFLCRGGAMKLELKGLGVLDFKMINLSFHSYFNAFHIKFMNIRFLARVVVCPGCMQDVFKTNFALSRSFSPF